MKFNLLKNSFGIAYLKLKLIKFILNLIHTDFVMQMITVLHLNHQTLLSARFLPFHNEASSLCFCKNILSNRRILHKKEDKQLKSTNNYHKRDDQLLLKLSSCNIY